MFVLVRGISWLAVLLVSVLVTTQTLGLVHSITHGPSGSMLQAHEHDHGPTNGHAHDHADVQSADSGSFLTLLFSSHLEAADCRLYDQAGHEGALVMARQLPLPVVPPPLTVAIFQGEALARWAALFDARGPPLTA